MTDEPPTTSDSKLANQTDLFEEKTVEPSENFDLEPAEPTESTEPTESAEPTESTEPTELIEPIESAEPIENVESVSQSGFIETIETSVTPCDD